MPSSKTHVQVGHHIGGWSGGTIAAYHFLGPGRVPLLEGVSFLELPLYALTVWAASRLGSHLPDLLEPPETSRHRGVFHSVVAYLLVLGKVAWLWVWFVPASTGPIWTYIRIFIVFVGMSYAAHLHLDAHTSDSIPWFSE